MSMVLIMVGKDDECKKKIKTEKNVSYASKIHDTNSCPPSFSALMHLVMGGR